MKLYIILAEFNGWTTVHSVHTDENEAELLSGILNRDAYPYYHKVEEGELEVSPACLKLLKK